MTFDYRGCHRARVLVVDPPWRHDDALGKRGARAHYGDDSMAEDERTISTDDLCDLRLPPLADDCLLFLWRLSNMQEDAIRVLHAWGFGPVKSEVVWRKQAKGSRVCKECGIPRDHFGMGRYSRNCHEIALIGRRGNNIATPGRQRSVFRALPPRLELTTEVDSDRYDFEARVGEHSEKPDEFYYLVRALTLGVGPYVELFGRRRRYGWRVYGAERDKFPPVTKAQTPKLELPKRKRRRKPPKLKVIAGGAR